MTKTEHIAARQRASIRVAANTDRLEGIMKLYKAASAEGDQAEQMTLAMVAHKTLDELLKATNDNGHHFAMSLTTPM